MIWEGPLFDPVLGQFFFSIFLLVCSSWTCHISRSPINSDTNTSILRLWSSISGFVSRASKCRYIPTHLRKLAHYCHVLCSHPCEAENIYIGLKSWSILFNNRNALFLCQIIWSFLTETSTFSVGILWKEAHGLSSDAETWNNQQIFLDIPSPDRNYSLEYLQAGSQQ